MSTLTLRVPDELERALERQSTAMGISKSDLAREALKRYLRVAEFRTLRTKLVARKVTEFLTESGDRLQKTIIFCVDQEHADEMRHHLTNENADLVQEYPDYVCRVTSDEGDIGGGHLGRFQDFEAEIFQHLFRVFAHAVIVLDHENGLAGLR